MGRSAKLSDIFIGPVAFSAFVCQLFDHSLLVLGEVSYQAVNLKVVELLDIIALVWALLAQGSIGM